MKKLPIIKIMSGALYYPWALRKPLSKALSILIVAGVVLTTTWWHTEENAPEHFGWVVVALFWALYALFAVICHRVVLLGAQSVPEYGITRISGRDFRFALGVAKIMLISFPAVIVGSVVFQIPIQIFNVVASDALKIEIPFKYLLWVVSLIQTYVFVRFGLILPATAIDERPSLQWAWHTSRGNTLRLMLVLGFLPWLVTLPLGLFPDDVGIIGYCLFILMWWLLLPIEITVLSLSY